MRIVRFIKRRKSTIFMLGIIVVAVYLGANLLAYSLTYKPEACLSCHIMKPYYDNWKASSHNKVTCIDCHPYRPSTIVFSAVRYLTGSYRLPLKSSVEDKECILCHKPETIKVVNFKGTVFNHIEHIKKSKRGKSLHCTSCHYSVVQSTTHIQVDQNVCTLCHFLDTPPQYNQNCTVCHGRTRKQVKVGEVAFDHESFLKTGARCVECHSQTVAGTGQAPEERCRECHVQRSTEGKSAERLHQIHTTDHYVNCFSCHEKMEHGRETIHFSRAIDLNCNECHSTPHDTNRDMYMGIGAKGVADMPAAMYISRVRCTACHSMDKSLGGKNALARSWESKKKSCVLCHKPGYDDMAEDWKKQMTSFTQALSGMVDEYGKALGKRQDRGALANEFRTIEGNLRFLKEARGEHNIKYAYEIGKSIAAGVQKGYSKAGIAGKPALPAALAKPDGICQFCHSSYLPKNAIQARSLHNIKFDHPMHIEMGLECTKCHDPKLHRLGGGLIKAACKECHADMKL